MERLRSDALSHGRALGKDAKELKCYEQIGIAKEMLRADWTGKGFAVDRLAKEMYGYESEGQLS